MQQSILLSTEQDRAAFCSSHALKTQSAAVYKIIS